MSAVPWVLGFLLLILCLDTCFSSAQQEGVFSAFKRHPHYSQCQELGRLASREADTSVDVWAEKEEGFCRVTFQPAAKQLQGTRSVTAITSYRVHHELLSEVIYNVHHAHGRQHDTIRAYHPHYSSFEQALGIQYSSVLCFPRLSLLWRRLFGAGSSATGSGRSGSSAAEDVGGVSDWFSHQWRWDVLTRQPKLPSVEGLLAKAAMLSDAVASGSCHEPPHLLWWPSQLHPTTCDSAWHVPAVVWWLLWLLCPAALVAHDCLKVAHDYPWLCLYVCVIATFRTFAEGRALYIALRCRQLCARDKLYRLACSHLLTVVISVMETGLVTAWLPLLSQSSASGVMWCHLLGLPVATVWGMWLSWRMSAPLRPPSPPVQSSRSQSQRRRSASTAAPAATAATAVQEGQPAPLMRSWSAAAAAAAAVHWPPPLEIPSWLDDVTDVPDAYRCPITLGIMREPAQASSGVTYERTAIFKWLDHHRVDPVCHVPVKRHRLTPNLSLRSIIETWAKERGQRAGHGQGGVTGQGRDGDIVSGKAC